MTMILPVDQIDDWQQRLDRQDAFWDRAVLDRPVCHITVPRPEPARPWPTRKTYRSHRERWMDTDRLVQEALASVANTIYLGDALPHVWPNLGPEVFSAFFGMDMEYTADTSWAKPMTSDWSEVGLLRFSEENFYWRKLCEMTDALLEAGRGRFYVGLTDFHVGGDALAAFRDPADLNADLLLTPEPIKRFLDYVTKTYFRVFDLCHEKLVQAGQPISTWLGIVSTRKWYPVSNDFSCMVSRSMFEEFFLPGIVEECRFLDASIYHLDGPGALRHLDALLEIPELDAVQWVYGAGQGRASDWVSVYKRCQNAGKGVYLHIQPDELDWITEQLRPEGVWLAVDGLASTEEAQTVLARLSRWT